MTAMSRKTTACAALASLLAASALAAPPAAADGFYGHGWGYGGWGGYRHYHHHGWGHSNEWGAPVAAGLLGFAAGAAIAAQSPSYYESCYLAERPVRDDWGDIIAYRRVRVCD